MMSPPELATAVPLGAFVAFMIGESFFRSFGLAGFASALSQRVGDRFRIIGRKRFAGQLRQEVVIATRVALFDAVVIAALTLVGFMPGKPSNPWVHLYTFLAVFAWYEVWFYALHRLMHTRLLWRFHEVHHRAGVPHALTSMSFSLLERAGLLFGSVGVAGIAAYFVPVSGLGVFAYAVLNTSLNALGHANADFFPRVFARQNVIGTATYHVLHHERGDQNFGLFTTLLDGLFGTRADDWRSLFLRVKDGRRL